MKKTNKMVVLFIILAVILAFIPLNMVKAAITDGEDEDAQIIRKTTTNYFTTVKIEGTLTNEKTGETESFTKSSDELDGNVDDELVASSIESLKKEFSTWASEKGAKDIKFSNEEVSDYYYDAHDEITQSGTGETGNSNVILVGDIDDLDNAYATQGTITINTILDKHQTYTITANATIKEEAEKSEYKILDGADQTVDINKNEELSFRANIEYSDFLASGKVYVDGEVVDASNYTSKEGSTIITFNQSYVNSLNVGNHSFKIAIANGETSTNFTIAKSEPAQKSPQTGDNIMIFVTTLIISALGAVVILKKK